MTQIRVDTAELQASARRFQQIAQRLRELGSEVSEAAAHAPSYEGQFAPRVRALADEGQAHLTRQANRLEELGDQLALHAAQFEQADRETLTGLMNIAHMLMNWMTGIGLVASARENGDRQPQEETLLPYPSYPTPDPGSGPFNSVDPALADYAFENLLLLGALQWEVAQDRPDAARHMRHYLEGSGDPLEVDVETMLNDMPRFQLTSQAALDEFMHDIELQVASQYQGTPLDFQVGSPWHSDFYATQADYPNWFFAMGGFSYAYSAEVRVIPPTTIGEDPTVEVSYQMHVWDYYNWDQGKSVTIPRPGVPITGDPLSFPIPEEYQEHIEEVGDSWRVNDTALARLHLGGLAQEYEIVGQTEVSVQSYALDTGSRQFEPVQPGQVERPPGR